MKIKQYDSEHYRIVELTDDARALRPDDVLTLLEKFHSAELRLAGVHFPGDFIALVYEKCPAP